MEKTITVQELVDKYTSASDKFKPQILKEIKSEQYIDYMTKCSILETIVNSTHLDKNKHYLRSRTAEYMLFSVHVINLYTNIKFDQSNIINEFNELNKAGLIDILLNTNPERESIIPSKEIIECGTILGWLNDDFDDNSSIHSILYNTIMGLDSDTINILTNMLNEKK